ncbi:MAG: vitamin K epoxide reductase family protein, partial [Dehalococcoidia bacterium]
CLSGDDCATVLAGPYARVMGIPLSLLGLVMYAVLTGLGLLLLSERKSGQGLIALGTYAVALGGTLYSAYLFYLQLFEIHALCTWCLASAVVVTTILLLSLKRLFAQGQKGHR